MTPARIPALLVTGTRGAGKSTYISRLLAQRPAGSRWAVLVNDIGEAAIDVPNGAPEHEVVVREVAGCICCSAQVSLRAAVVALVRERRPERLVIEASAAAHPSAIVKVLEEPGIAAAVVLERTVCIVDPAHALDERYVGLGLFREQARSADAVVLSKSDVSSAETSSAARAALLAFGSACVT